MPIYSQIPEDEIDYVAKNEQTSTAQTTESRDFANSYMAGGIRTPGSAIAATVGGVALDLVDTVASSILPGIERQEVNEAFLNAVGSPGLIGWFDQNKGAIEVGSGVAGIIGSIAITDKILKPAGAVMRVARSVPWVSKVAALDAQYDRAVRLATLTNRELARRGAVGAERFVGGELNLAALSNPALNVTAKSAAQGVRKAQIARGAVYNLTTEGVMALTLNSNQFLYADDLAHNLVWSGVGLAGGAIADSMIASYTLRKIANSSAVRRLNAGAYDPTGKEADRINANLNLMAADPDFASLAFTFTGKGGVTDLITSKAIQAAELQKKRGITERARALFGKREAIANPILKMAAEDLNKVTTGGLRGVSRAGFVMDTEGLGAPLVESLVREPAFLYGIEEIGTTVEGAGIKATADLRDAAVKEELARTQELLVNNGKWRTRKVKRKDGSEYWVDELIPLSDEARAELQARNRELQFAASHTPVTMLEPGEWSPISMGEIADNYKPRPIMKETLGEGKDGLMVWGRERLEKAEPPLGIRSDGDLILPANAPIDRLETQDMLHLYHIGNKMVRDMAAANRVLTLPEKANWFQLDLAEQLLRATGNPNAVVWPAGMTRESALVESFAQKVDALKKRQGALKMATKRGVDVLDETQAFKNKIYFNLPRLTSYQQGLLGTSEHPFDLMMAGFKNGDDVRSRSFEEVLKAMRDSKTIVGLTDDTVENLDSLQGNSFNFLMDRDGNPIKPIIAYKRPMAPNEWSQDDLLVRQATRAAFTRDKLVGEDADPLIREIVNLVTADPAFAQAGKVMELADDQSRSFVPGFENAAPQSTMGAALNAITSRERRDVDNLTMLAASQVRERQTRIVQGIMRNVITEAMGDSITRVNSPRNITSKLGLNQIHSFRQGWELLREPMETTLPKGKGYSFVLDHESELNKTRFEEAFGRPLTKGQQLMNPNGQVIVLDELAMEVFQREQRVHARTIAMKNTILRSMGLSEIKIVPWYVPPPNTKNKFLAYTFDAQNNVIPGMTIVADTAEELAKMKAQLEKSPQWKVGYTVRQRSQIESFMDLWDKAQMDYIAPNVTAIQPKKRGFGRTGGNEINSSAFDEAMITMRDSLLGLNEDLTSVLFREPIKSAKARASIAKVESAAGSRNAEQHSSIYDRYIQNLTGLSSLSAKDSYLGEVSSWAERRLNGWLQSDVASSISDTYQALKDYLSSARPNHGRASKERFDKLSRELGQYMPYKTAMEMVEKETGSKTPAEVAEITSKLSWFEAASRLRWLESFHAVANIGGILTNTPAVIRALQPMAGETLEDAARRNSSLSMLMATPSGDGVVIPHVNKLLYHAMKDAWKKVPDEFTTKGIKLGYFDQEVAEMNSAWGAIDSKDGWRGFVFGNPAAEAEKGAGIFSRLAAKVARSGGIDKWASILSDKSEAFTRSWGMYAGRRVAEAIGIKNVDEQLSFAHDMTNKLIANYDPRNRPEIFQGALGAPLGLFQSYVMNYYQRMFRYIETKNGRALATQFAAQAGVFGMQSVPGWNALNWAFFDRQQAENDDPVESLYNRFGQFDGDLIMHGTLSNIPKLFGMDGISLYTRGDTEIRMPVNPITAVGSALGLNDSGAGVQFPVLDTAKRIVTGMGQVIDSFWMTGGIGRNHAAEIVSNMVTNRPLAGMIETFGADGYDTSMDGQVVAESRNAFETTMRILGVRAMQQQKETELFYQNRNAQEEQNSRKDILRSATRAAIRQGDFDAVPGLYAKYVEQGGDPKYYSRWLKESFKAALDTRGERMLEKALKDKDNSKNAYIGRLLDAQVGVKEDEDNAEDYGRAAEQERLIQQGWEIQPDLDPAATGPFDETLDEVQ